ncbi:serine hydrolase domain-containing protein [Planosporangium sp. 12N6]|uniref:serine hydrolase domain-containing protein n=1 Tax=Planosporangium spinosum TaxID=3402278 RepID=UPI003CF656DE
MTRGTDTDDVVRALQAACDRQALRVTSGIDDMAGYLAAGVRDLSHREVIGPLRPGAGASGMIVHRGRTAARWGDCSIAEMCFSATKSVLSTVAGLAYDRRLLPDPYAPVAAAVDHPAFTGPDAREVTWHHLLQQTSGWDGELWGKPSRVDAQSGDYPPGTRSGDRWAYNDVRVNLLALALTLLWRRPLADVLREELMDPIGASPTWSWHGYRNAFVAVGGRRVPVVSGGAHWGGGLWASAGDLARLGVLYLRRGRWRGRRLLSEEWIDATWQPCDRNPDYGYLWWLNTRQRVFPTAPASGRCARGNLGRHLLWVDPDRDLVIASHWGEDVGVLLREASAIVTPAT